MRFHFLSRLPPLVLLRDNVLHCVKKKITTTFDLTSWKKVKNVQDSILDLVLFILTGNSALATFLL